MKKHELVVLIIALLVLIISIALEVNAQAGVMDEQLSQIQQQIEIVQADYARAHGYYVQILPIHPEKPEPASPREPLRAAPATLISPLAAPIRPAYCPADYTECPPVELPDRDISITVNVYVNAHLGPGYEIVAEYTDERGLWRRVINYGPETERNRDWYEVND